MCSAGSTGRVPPPIVRGRRLRPGPSAPPDRADLRSVPAAAGLPASSPRRPRRGGGPENLASNPRELSAGISADPGTTEEDQPIHDDPPASMRRHFPAAKAPGVCVPGAHCRDALELALGTGPRRLPNCRSGPDGLWPPRQSGVVCRPWPNRTSTGDPGPCLGWRGPARTIRADLATRSRFFTPQELQISTITLPVSDSLTSGKLPSAKCFEHREGCPEDQCPQREEHAPIPSESDGSDNSIDQRSTERDQHYVPCRRAHLHRDPPRIIFDGSPLDTSRCHAC